MRSATDSGLGLEDGLVVPYFPPELRGHVAQYCTGRTLARLCLVDRLWAAEAEPMLYTSVLLSPRRKEVAVAFIDGVARSPYKSLYIQSMVISQQDGFAWPGVLVEAMHRLLLTLTNLVDLRFRGLALRVQQEFFMWIGEPDCPFRLRSMYASWDVVFSFPTFHINFLRLHMPTLDVLAIEGQSREQIIDASRLPDDEAERALVLPSCVVFGYFQDAAGITLHLDDADPTKIATIARSIAVDPSPHFASASVDALPVLDMQQSDASSIARAFSTHFPDIHYLRAVVPAAADVDSIFESIMLFTSLEVLHVVEDWQNSNFIPEADPMPWPARRELAMEGCPCIREIVLTDGYITTRATDENGGLTEWYDDGTWLDRLHNGQYWQVAEGVDSPSSS